MWRRGVLQIAIKPIECFKSVQAVQEFGGFVPQGALHAKQQAFLGCIAGFLS